MSIMSSYLLFILSRLSETFPFLWPPHLDSSNGREHNCQGPQIVHLSQISPNT
jgi:hypothetical protein